MDSDLCRRARWKKILKMNKIKTEDARISYRGFHLIIETTNEIEERTLVVLVVARPNQEVEGSGLPPMFEKLLHPGLFVTTLAFQEHGTKVPSMAGQRFESDGTLLGDEVGHVVVVSVKGVLGYESSHDVCGWEKKETGKKC